MKKFKEYIAEVEGFSLGSYSHMAPMASLGDYPPKGSQHRSKRAVGINANYRSGKGMGTYKAMGSLNNDTNRIPRKKGQPAGSDKHSDLYTDENPKGTIHGLGFTDGETAKKSVSKIKNSGKTHAHKMQAAIAMSQRAKVASERAKDPEKKKNLGQAHKIYQSYIDTNKKNKD